jgi:ribulose-bisphosphate carboxylase large chain
MTEFAERIVAVYEVTSDARAIEARAEALALEQSIELPLSAVSRDIVDSGVVGRVTEIEERASGLFRVHVSLAAATAPPEAGQLMNILFGNSSLQADVELVDVDFPDAHVAAFGGPRVGLAGLREKVGAGARALTATALKPQGLPVSELARLAGGLALGGLDIIKDDHGLADQPFSPFAKRVAACAAAVRDANRLTGRRTRYAPSLSGDLDALRKQLRIATDEGLDVVLVAPMVLGLPAFQKIAREAADMAFLAHPSMAGAGRIAPDLLLGKIFRLLGADATIFPNHGGRFSYRPATCRAIAERALGPWATGVGALRQTAPAPAGGMTLDRLGELMSFYSRDAILLIGGSLLSAADRLTDAAADFQRRVEAHGA